MNAPEPVRLKLLNPSPDRPRGGVVVTPWEPISRLLGAPEHVRVYRDYDPTYRVELTSQIDRIELNDRSRDELLFLLDQDVRAGDENYGTVCGHVSVEAADSPSPYNGRPHANAKFHGVEFTDEYLYAWLNTCATHDDDNPWFGGALTSFKWHGEELLDPLDQDWGIYNPDKRAAQIDRIHFVRPPWDEEASFDAFVFNRHWRCETTCNGPLRATATILSEPFVFTCRDADQRRRRFVCSVHRAVSVHSGNNLITERIRVKADVDGPTPVVDMWFAARYFMLVNLTVDQSITFRYPNHPGWLAVLAPEHVRAKHGYAFATNAYAGPIWHPPVEHGDPSTGHLAFSWELGATRLATVAHLFRRDTNTQALTDAIGWTWYDLLYKPLRAEL